MKITAELDISAITVAEDEMLVLVFPADTFPPPIEPDEPWEDPIMDALKEKGLGERVFIIYADGVQMTKVKKT